MREFFILLIIFGISFSLRAKTIVQDTLPDLGYAPNLGYNDGCCKSCSGLSSIDRQICFIECRGIATTTSTSICTSFRGIVMGEGGNSCQEDPDKSTCPRIVLPEFGKYPIELIYPNVDKIYINLTDEFGFQMLEVGKKKTKSLKKFVERKKDIKLLKPLGLSRKSKIAQIDFKVKPIYLNYSGKATLTEEQWIGNKRVAIFKQEYKEFSLKNGLEFKFTKESIQQLSRK